MARYPIDLPVSYIPGQLEKTTSYFTTFYLGNYVDNDFRENVGSHCGVDIVPPKPAGLAVTQIAAVPVYAVLSGTVIAAQSNGFAGLFVVVRHDHVPDPSNPSATCSLCSCYEHLSELAVTEGQQVSEGDILGKTGNTGNTSKSATSSGEHLHFQMDRPNAPFHAYWPYSLKEANDQGYSWFTAANAGLGIERARQWTVNPLVYLDALAKGTSVAVAIFGSTTTSTALASATSVFSTEATILNTSAPTTSSPAKPTTDTARLGAASAELFGSPSTPTVATSFSDVTNDPAITWIAQQGIAAGFEDGTFRPKNPLTRAEFLKLIFKFGNIVPHTSDQLVFADVDPSQWAAPYVATAHSKGWIRGYSDGKFRPNSPVTRLEALGMTLNILIGKDEIARAGLTTTLRDIPAGSWGIPYVGFAEKYGLMTTFAGQKFLPNNPMLRVRMAELLYKLHTQLGLRAV